MLLAVKGLAFTDSDELITAFECRMGFHPHPPHSDLGLSAHILPLTYFSRDKIIHSRREGDP